MLQSHYPNRPPPDSRWTKLGKIDCWPTLAPSLGDFFCRWLICRSAQVKSFVDRSADFQGFCHRLSVGDGRLMIDWLFKEIYIMISAEGRLIDHRASIGQRLPDGRSMTFYQRTPRRGRISSFIRPIIAQLSADHKLGCVLYCLQCMYAHYLWNHIMH